MHTVVHKSISATRAIFAARSKIVHYLTSTTPEALLAFGAVHVPRAIQTSCASRKHRYPLVRVYIPNWRLHRVRVVGKRPDWTWSTSAIGSNPSFRANLARRARFGIRSGYTVAIAAFELVTRCQTIASVGGIITLAVLYPCSVRASSAKSIDPCVVLRAVQALSAIGIRLLPVRTDDARLAKIADETGSTLSADGSLANFRCVRTSSQQRRVIFRRRPHSQAVVLRRRRAKHDSGTRRGVIGDAHIGGFCARFCHISYIWDFAICT